jgi:hypothetical protein
MHQRVAEKGGDWGGDGEVKGGLRRCRRRIAGRATFVGPRWTIVKPIVTIQLSKPMTAALA